MPGSSTSWFVHNEVQQDNCSASYPDFCHAVSVLPCRLAAARRSEIGHSQVKRGGGCRRLPLPADCAQCLCTALLQAPPAKKVESEEESSDDESSDEEEVRAAVTTPSRASCCSVLLVGGPVLLASGSARSGAWRMPALSACCTSASFLLKPPCYTLGRLCTELTELCCASG